VFAASLRKLAHLSDADLSRKWTWPGKGSADLRNAFFFIGSRWRDPGLRTFVEDSDMKPAEGVDECEVVPSCSFQFTSSEGRTGPVVVTVPPGYGHADQQNRRYPVIYLLHGYGQSPEDFEALVLFLKQWMNGSMKSMASRMPKVIFVFADGRCRIGATGKPECISGTFYAESPRKDGAHMESWFLELVDYVDHHYRTMGETVEDWTE